MNMKHIEVRQCADIVRKTISVGLIAVALSGSTVWADAPSGYFYDVPVIGQGLLLHGKACAQTSVSMVMGFWNRKDSANKTATPQELSAMMEKDDFDPITGLTNPLYMDNELKELGYDVFKAHPQNEAELARLLKDGPVIAMIKKGRISHSVVVTGISADREIVTVNDPNGNGTGSRMAYKDFDKGWAANKNENGVGRGVAIVRPTPHFAYAPVLGQTFLAHFTYPSR